MMEINTNWFAGAWRPMNPMHLAAARRLAVTLSQKRVSTSARCPTLRSTLKSDITDCLSMVDATFQNALLSCALVQISRASWSRHDHPTSGPRCTRQQLASRPWLCSSTLKLPPPYRRSDELASTLTAQRRDWQFLCQQKANLRATNFRERCVRPQQIGINTYSIHRGRRALRTPSQLLVLSLVVFCWWCRLLPDRFTAGRWPAKR